MPDVIPVPVEDRKSTHFDEDMEGDIQATNDKAENTPLNKVKLIDKDIDKGVEGKQIDDHIQDQLIKIAEGVDPEQPRKARCRRPWIICFILFLIVSLALGITAIVLTQMYRHPPRVKPSVNFHHAFFHLKTEGYKKLYDPTNLQWLEDESQNVGNIKLLNGTYFYIPQDGFYQINFAVQLHIPQDTPASIVTLMLQRKNNGKSYVFMKKSSTSLKIPEHDLIQSSFRYKFKAEDTVVLRMNMAKFISRNKHSSYLYISRLNINNDQ